MNNLSKIFTLAATLTLAAGCDAEPELGDVDGDSDIAFRPSGFGSGYSLNTSWMGKHAFDMVDFTGLLYHGAKLDRVCARPKQYGGDEVCFYPKKGDRLWVEKSEIVGEKWGKTFRGYDFVGSQWFFFLDYDGDNVIDSWIIPRIEDVSHDLTHTGMPYYAYYWTYYTSDAGGKIVKDIEQQPDPVPLCEKDPDSGDMRTIVSADLEVDMIHGDFGKRPESMFVGCSSGAVGKAQMTWGYLFYDVGYKFLETAVRVVRADYCGSGDSYTKPGQQVQVEDALGINAFFDPFKDTEAHWVVGGAAACLNTPRYSSYTYEDVALACGIKKCGANEPFGSYGDEIQTKN